LAKGITTETEAVRDPSMLKTTIGVACGTTAMLTERNVSKKTMFIIKEDNMSSYGLPSQSSEDDGSQ
jgi:hypothetical protein